MNVLFKKAWLRLHSHGSCVALEEQSAGPWGSARVARRTFCLLRMREVKPTFCIRWISKCNWNNRRKRWIYFSESGFPVFILPHAPSLLFVTAKQADKPTARANVARNKLKINWFLPNLRAWVCLSAHVCVRCWRGVFFCEKMYVNLCIRLCSLKWKLLT